MISYIHISCFASKTVLFVVECVQSPGAFFANRLYNAMNGAGTDDATLIRVIVSRCEIDLETVKKEFERIYDRTLFSCITVNIFFLSQSSYISTLMSA